MQQWPCFFFFFCLSWIHVVVQQAQYKSMQPTVSTHLMSKVPQCSTQIIDASGQVVPQVVDASDGLRRRNAGNQHLQKGSLGALKRDSSWQCQYTLATWTKPNSTISSLGQGASEACQDNSPEVRAALWVGTSVAYQGRVRNDPY